jgi:hypothetical protein
LRLIATSTCVNQSNSKPAAKSQSIFSVLRALLTDKQRVVFGSFFEALTGQLLQERWPHPLLSKGYLHEYSNRDETITILTGTITKCWKHFINRNYSFTVTLNEHQIRATSNYSITERKEGAFIIDEVVSEEMAWGGYQKFCRSISDKKSNDSNLLDAPYHVNWCVPSKRQLHRSFQRHPYLKLEFQQSVLQFDAGPSTIKGAGTGLFVRVVNGKDFVLQPGEMLDLGIYAPLKVGDIKPKHIALLKNLIYDWRVETWSFAGKVKRSETCIFDPTDNYTGKRDFNGNIIAFINETCRSDEVANVSAQYDPEGNVHYLLGHWEESEGQFTVQSGAKPLELLVSLLPVHFSAESI